MPPAGKRAMGASLGGGVKLRTRRLGPASLLAFALAFASAWMASHGDPLGLPRAHAADAHPAMGRHVAAVTDHPEATKAALDVLRRGGTAADGAVAAALALGVVNPSASGLGGGGFALVYDPKSAKVAAIDFRETAGAHIDAEELAKGYASGASIGVPGEPAGLAYLLKHHGKLSYGAVAAPAIRLARGGFIVGPHVSDMTKMLRGPLGQSPALGALFLPGGAPLSPRSRMRRPNLAKTLERFAKDGANPFYRGDIAAKIVSAAQQAGSKLTVDDFARYAVHVREPLSLTFGDRKVYTMPAPSAGGLMLLETLGLYGADGKSELVAAGFGSSRYLHLLAEAMRGAISDRMRFAADPDHDSAVVGAYEEALRPARLKARRKLIRDDATMPVAKFRTAEDGTSHLIVTDAWGGVVSLTTTVNGPFGARIIAGDTGILLNNELDDFTSPKQVEGLGIVGLGPNRPRPYARPVSSMAPTIVLERGKPVLALGGSGGTRIATGVTQVAVCRLVFALDPARCVGAPRIHPDTNKLALYLEPEHVVDVRQGLEKRGEKLDEERFLKTAVHAVAWESDESGRQILAAPDPRKAALGLAQ